MIRMRLQLWYLGYLVWVVIGLTLAVTGASAQDDAAFVTHRQKVMQSIGGHMGAIGEIMKNTLPYQGTIAAPAQALQMNSKVIEEAFEKAKTLQ